MTQSVAKVVDFNNNDEVCVWLDGEKHLAKVVEKRWGKSIVEISTIVGEEVIPYKYTVPNNNIVNVIVTASYQFI